MNGGSGVSIVSGSGFLGYFKLFQPPPKSGHVKYRIIF